VQVSDGRDEGYPVVAGAGRRWCIGECVTSAPHEYPRKGRYKIAVKVIDILGNDTTKAVEVTV
jgi:hypothetical protein